MYGKAPKEYLSLWSVIALGIGSMVGAGIFALMGQATLMAGKNVYWSFILGGVAALLSGYTYAKLGSRYPGSGGIMDYFNEAFSHKTLSGALTLIYLGTLVITVALVAKSFGAYASRLFLPDRQSPFIPQPFLPAWLFCCWGIEYGGSQGRWKVGSNHGGIQIIDFDGFNACQLRFFRACGRGSHSGERAGRFAGQRGVDIFLHLPATE